MLLYQSMISVLSLDFKAIVLEQTADLCKYIIIHTQAGVENKSSQSLHILYHLCFLVSSWKTGHSNI